MYYYTKEKLMHLLGDTTDIDNSSIAAYRVSSQSEGPAGYFNKWDFIRGKKNCWQSIESIPNQHTKKKIIFSDSLFRKRAPSAKELAFFSALIEYYDVYVWPDINKPIKQSKAFWDNTTHVEPATEREVKKSLTQQGISANDFLILDTLNYQEIEKREKEIENQEALNHYVLISDADEHEVKIQKELTQVDFNLISLKDPTQVEHLEKSIEKSRIKALKVTAPTEEELKQLFQAFPNLETIEINAANVRWLEKNLEKLNGLNVVLVNTDFDSLYTIPHSVKLKNLTIKCNPKGEKLVTLEINTPDIENLILENFNNLNLKNTAHPTHMKTLKSIKGSPSFIQGFEAVDEITVQNAAKETKPLPTFKVISPYTPLKGNEIDFSELTHLETLVIQNSMAKSIQLNASCAPHLKNLRICTFGYLENLNFTQNDVLQTLEILDCPNLPLLDLTNLTSLKNVCVYTLNLTAEKIHFPSKLKNIDMYQCKNLSQLNLKNQSSLESITLDELPSLENIDLPVGIKEIHISHCENLFFEDTLNYSAYHELEIIDLKNINNTTLTIQSPSVKYLRVKSAKELQSLDFSQCNALEELAIENCEQLENIDFTSLPNLKRLTLKCLTNLKKIDISPCTTLEMLEVRDCSLEKLDITPSIKNLTISSIDNPMSLNFLPTSSLEQVTLNGCSGLTQLTLEHHPTLKELTISKATTCSLSIDQLPELRKLEFVGKDLALDVKRCPQLQQAYIDASKNLEVNHFAEDSAPRWVKLFAPSIPKNFLNLNPSCQLQMNTYTSSSDPSMAAAKNQRFLQQQNEESPVSIFSFYKKISLDNDTGIPNSTYQAQGKFLLTLSAQQFISKNRFRTMVHDQVEYENGVISFLAEPNRKELTSISANKIHPFDGIHSPDGKNLIQQQQSLIEQDGSLVSGYFTGEFLHGEIYPLPTNGPVLLSDIEEIYCHPPGSINVFWHPKHQQYYFEQVTQNNSATIEILYRFKRNADYNNALNVKDKIIEEPPNQLLPNKLLQEIWAKLNFNQHSQSSLYFLIDPKTSLEEKIQSLFDFCKNFTNDSLTQVSGQDGMSILSDLIREPKGACRHRAEVFMLLARFIGVPALLISNETHAFCDIPSQSKTGIGYKRIDFGGAPLVDLTPQDARKTIFDTTSFSKPSITTPKILTPDEIQEQKYVDQLEALVKTSQIKSIHDIYPRHKNVLSPLIKLTNKQNSLEVNAEIIQQLKPLLDLDNEYIYIHDPNDFEFYLSPQRLKNGELKKDVGPLSKLIEKGGVIVVNWGNFTPNQITSYKSILDSEPTLLGKTIDKNVTVIGLIPFNHKSCDAFSSRCTPFTVGNDFFQSQHQVVTPDMTNAIEVDLFNHPILWEEKLMGVISMQEHSIKLSDGPLIQAIKQNKPLIIHNPPHPHASFDALIHRLRHEGKIIYQGEGEEILKIPDHFMIQLDTKPHADALDAVTIHISTSKLNNKTPIYLGLHNLNECFEHFYVNDGKAHTDDNELLGQYDPAKHIFYVTESIPDNDWKMLLDRIASMYPNKYFDFVLAPGVTVSQTTNTSPPERSFTEPTSLSLLPKQHILISNDPDYISEKLAKKMGDETEIVDITPQTSFDQLFYKINIEKNENNVSSFFVQEQDVLTRLKAGKTVILNGMLSPQLYQKLLPLLNSKPPTDLYLNGEWVSIKGQLIAVMPKAAKNTLPLTQYVKCNVELNDYRNDFSNNDQDQLQCIFSFYRWAKELKHEGLGVPERFQLTHQRIKRMLHVLNKNSLNRRNPVKGIIQYDYPKHSEEYAYLNVLAKYFFKMHDKSDVRLKKLQQLYQRFNLSSPDNLKKHSWKVLNCFSGEVLSDLLGEPLNVSITSDHTLTDVAFSKLQTVIAQYLGHEPIQLTSSDARIQKLKLLLDDPHTPLIILKGPPGMGKSYASRKLKELSNCAYTEGEENIAAWLNGKPDRVNVLLLDEANMAKPGTWDFLKGLSRDKKSVYYRGKQYLLDNHKIIVTANPENFPNRFYHSFFQHYGETIYFAKPSPDFIEQDLLKPILQPHGLFQHAKLVVSACDLMDKYRPFYPCSLRDIENVARRFVYLKSITTNQAETEILWQACVTEFAGSIENTQKRYKLMAEFADQFGLSLQVKTAEPVTLIPLNQARSLPSTKKYLIDAIEQDLEMREIGCNKQYVYPTGILLEGEPGVGKSTLFKTLLERKGFSKNHTDPSKRYYEISAGSNEVYTILLKAFHEGSVVILDEINIDNKKLETLLNQLLTGYDLTGHPPKNPGFMLLSSQNPGYYAGREAQSAALLNRMHMLYMDNFTQDEITALASEKQLPLPHMLGTAFKKITEKYPEEANQRTLFTLIDTLSQTKTQTTTQPSLTQGKKP